MNSDHILPINLALISVFDKNNLEQLATFLQNQKISILSTGGTRKILQSANIDSTEVAEYTGFPEIMSGRLKTLHPKIHGGILGRSGEDDTIMQTAKIKKIDLVVTNFYPFAKTIQKSDCDFLQAIENIDIGGPAMVRAAAKNHHHVAIIVDYTDYQPIMEEIAQTGGIKYTTRLKLATKAFAYTSQYDAQIYRYFQNTQKPTELPDYLQLNLVKKHDLRYGENPHQQAALYSEKFTESNHFVQHCGKELSYNNLNDIHAAISCIQSFNEPACAIIKHSNPCGIAVGKNMLQNYLHAFETDKNSAFGGIIAINQKLDKEVANCILNNQFIEVIIAPQLDEEVLSIFSHKPNIRIISYKINKQTNLLYQCITNGFLVQTQNDNPKLTTKIVSQRSPSTSEMQDLNFALEVVKHTKSNAIVYAKNQRTLGIGAGQTSRIMSTRIATIKAQDAGFSLAGAVMASDAFFPFKDNLELAIQAGISAIIQPGGSIRDREIIQTADEHNIAMVFTGIRYFTH